MAVERVSVEHSALPEPDLRIMQFDPSNAEMVLIGETYVDSEYNRAAAIRRAEAAAQHAAARGLSLQYLVVRTTALAAFRA